MGAVTATFRAERSEQRSNVLRFMDATEFVEHVFEHCGVLPPRVKLAYGYALSRYLHVGIDHVASPDTGEVALLPDLVRLDERARELFAAPLQTSAGYRTVRHERELAERGYKTAGFVSPHSLGAAMDKQGVARDGESQGQCNARVRQAYRDAAAELALPAPRFGHRAYAERFLHVDLVFLLFAPYTALPHPSQWTELPLNLRGSLTAFQPGVEW